MSRSVRLLLLVASVACIVAGTVIAVRAVWFVRSSSVHGAALVRQERGSIASARRTGCRDAAVGGAGRVRGLLEAPALGLVAPVEEGTGPAVLDDAVGHVPASIWPGRAAGTSVFAAHNVTWFSGVNRLARGDTIRFLAACHSYTYRVTAHRVVRAGFGVYATAAPGLVLDTCYPLDALYPTSSRYLVYAALVRSGAAPRAAPRHPASQQRLAVPAPRALSGQGLGPGHNDVPLGTLRVAGSPAAAWRQADWPLQAAAKAVAAYSAMLRIAAQHRHVWWADLAPSVPVTAAAGLWRGEVTGYDRSVDVILRVRGGRLLGAVLTTVLTTSGSARPGSYHLRVTETVTSSGRLLISGFRMRPVGL